jgi:sialate O-acetylesterase
MPDTVITRPPVSVCRPIAVFFAVLGVVPLLSADVVLPALFSDHAVLQATTKVPVWGKADPGEAVTITLAKAHATAVAGSDGRWRGDLDLSAVGAGPFELVVQGRNRLVATDVLVGQVWLCSGQSNMEWPLRGSGGAAAEIARSANPQLRQFKVKNIASAMPKENVDGRWVVATAETTPDFTAAGYYFAKRLQGELHTPIGLINSSWGGTPVEAWTRLEGFAPDKDLAKSAKEAQMLAARYKVFLKDYYGWMSQQSCEDRTPATPANFDAFAAGATGWQSVQLPGTLASSPDAGSIWVSRKITLPASAVGSEMHVFFGDVKDAVKIYWNGAPMGEGGIESAMHLYRWKQVTSVEGVLSARIFNPSGAPTIAPKDARFRLDYKGGSLQLTGEWLAKTEFAFPPLPANAPACPEKPPLPRLDPHVASYLYNGMIQPLIPTAIAGVIWYQGEQNWDRGAQYATAFPLMIADWRAQWGQGDFPFYFCQLANYQQPPVKPGESHWAEVRAGQAAALALPRTGMAVLIDVGDVNNIHPADKLSVGERLARLALAKTYGKDVVSMGPTYTSGTIDSGKMRIAFSGADGGLVAKPLTPAAPRPQSEVQGFAICGKDHKWQWAQAVIEGATVIVWSPDVPAPVAVRYAWADNPICNLYNGAGLPAAPFRTDDFRLSSANQKY